MAFTGQARTGWCSYCFSLFPTSKGCELALDRSMNVELWYLRSPLGMHWFAGKIIGIIGRQKQKAKC